MPDAGCRKSVFSLFRYFAISPFHYFTISPYFAHALRNRTADSSNGVDMVMKKREIHCMSIQPVLRTSIPDVIMMAMRR